MFWQVFLAALLASLTVEGIKAGARKVRDQAKQEPIKAAPGRPVWPERETGPSTEGAEDDHPEEEDKEEVRKKQQRGFYS